MMAHGGRSARHMWKRWAGWVAGVLAAAAVVLAIAGVVLLPATDWIAVHYAGPVSEPLRALRLQAARDAVRGLLLTFVAVVFAVGALIVSGLNFSRLRRTVELTGPAQVTDRYTTAVGQLGSGKLDERIGAIRALERIARGSARDHPAVMVVLAAFVREHSRELRPKPGAGTAGDTPQGVTIRPNLQAAVTVVARRNPANDRGIINFHGADLTGADLTGANLTGGNLTNADLTRTILADAVLTGTDLARAILNNTDLARADLTRANLARANLAGANLTSAYLTAADLSAADLTGADLTGADLTGANLTGVTLTGANLTGAGLAAAGLDLAAADLAPADLTAAWFPFGAPVPQGWVRDAGSGRLRRVGGGPGDTSWPEG